VFKKKDFILSLIGMLGSCSVLGSVPDEPDADFKLSCSRWADSIIMCSDYIETDPITGYLKLAYYEDDKYYGTAFHICGGDLTLNTANPLADLVAEGETEGTLVCLDADENELKWGWDTETCVSVEWQNIYLSVDIPECPYDQTLCSTKGYGYLSVDL
jgi:hypothetical protein